MFALGIHYLTGYVAATDPWNRGDVEWPPHPGRVFMALAAAYFETKPDLDVPEARAAWDAEAEALRWLETLPPPELCADDADRRDVVDVYVPPNDMAANKLTVIPAFRTNRQPRTFPRARPRRAEVFLVWEDTQVPESHRAPMERLCAKVIRIGHSSSLTQMWLVEDETPMTPNLVPAEKQDPRPIRHRLRTFGPGTLDYLKTQFTGERLDEFFERSAQIQAAKGKAKKGLQAAFEESFGTPWKRSLDPPPSLRPVLTLTQEYVENTMPSKTPASSVFDANLLVLTKHEGPNLGLESTWQILTALRGAIETHCQPTPEWVSGHKPDKSPTENPHLALFPLAFVGSRYADGHLLGVGMAFPSEIPPRDRGKALRNLLYNANGTPADILLTLGKLGEWKLRLEERPSPPRALQPETWTRASDTWASVSPIVLDRHPKADPLKDRVGWVAEVSESIAVACERIGLPRPVEIDIDKTSWHRGAPRAKPGSDGYPLMPQRPGGPNRRQVHAWLRFAEPVQGPIPLGAGRYRGYGLCKPWRKAEES